MTQGAGKRAAPRRAAPRPDGASRRPALLALGVVACVAIWATLVFFAIDFGRSARGGDGAAWAFVAIASLGAIACLFTGLLLGVRLLRSLGALTPTPGEARPTGGRRAKR